FQAGFQQQLLHKWIADLNVRPLRACVFSEPGRRHAGAMNTVASRLRSDIDHGIAGSCRAPVKDFVFLENAKREGVHQRILRIAVREIDLAADSRITEAVSVKSNASDHAFENSLILWFVQRPESEAVHRGNLTRPHRENI